MKQAEQHPVDFSPYLDADSADPRFEQIRHHVQSCHYCSDQLREWRSVDEVFRSAGLDIAVPPSQWFKIRARLQQPLPALTWFDRLGLSSAPRRMAWSLGVSFVMLASLAVGVIEYRHYTERHNELTALAHFADSEEVRLRNATNPFRSTATDDRNPFTSYQLTRIQNKGNPFVR